MGALKRLNWTKLPAITGAHSGCLNCGPHPDDLPMQARIAVGFGYAALTCDGREVYSEAPGQEWEDAMTVEQAEARARRRPNHDWRITLDGPLSGRTYQRHGPKRWVLVEKNEGFA